jgi:chromosome segregation ATPase
VLDVVRELERRDAAVARAIEAASALERALEELRRQAEALAGRLARLPAERERLATARAAADDAVRAARRELGQAGEDEAAAARSGLERAEAGLEDIDAAAADLERNAAAAESERERLDTDARAAAERLAALERVHAVAAPRPGLAGVLDWSSRARAAVFVARSGLEQERERVVREAGELGASLLGEQIYTVKALADRLLEPRLAARGRRGARRGRLSGT